MGVRSPKYKVSRKLLCKLWGDEKDPFSFRNYHPGQHGQSVVRTQTPYYVQLNAKQRLRCYYYMREKQFANLFKMARSKQGDTGENFVGFLERRLDMILLRSNLVGTIFEARQIINHGHVLVDGKRLDIRSARIKDGQRVSLTPKGYSIKSVAAAIAAARRRIPDYLKVEDGGKTVTVVRQASFPEVPYDVIMDMKMVIEYYSN